jgi:GDP-L-fucose synthase
MFRNRRVLVTGGTGLIGIPLVRLLVEQGARVRVASLDDASRAHPQAEFVKTDLTDFCNCLRVCEDMETVFHLAGVKGSPAMTRRRPATFFFPTISFNTNMMEAARRSKVRQYLFTSTVGVYPPAERFYEDDAWKGFPSENDRFAGWAKRMGELQAEAYSIEHGWNAISIVRPSNVYGPWDSFDPETSLVVPSLIRRAVDGLESDAPFVVWGDGSPIRDFIHAEDVARGMIRVVEREDTRPVNLGSGQGVSIAGLVEIICDSMAELGLKRPRVEFDPTKPAGDRIRLHDTARARELGIEPSITLRDGVRETLRWFLENRGIADRRHHAFR